AIEVVSVFEDDVTKSDRGFEGRDLVAGIASDFGRLRQGRTVGLFHVEHVRGAKAHDGPRLVFAGVVPATADDGRHDRDALFAFADEAAETAPGVEPGDARCGRTLRHDQADVMQTVAMESR